MKNICLNGTFKIDLISHTQLPLRCWALNRFLSYAQTFHHLGRFVVAGSPQNTSISRQKTNKKKIPLGKNCCCRITMKDSNFETILKLGSFLVHNDLMMRDVAQVKHFCDSIHMWHEYIVFWCLPITIPGKAPHQREEIERTAQHFQGPEKTRNSLFEINPNMGFLVKTWSFNSQGCVTKLKLYVWQESYVFWYVLLVPISG